MSVRYGYRHIHVLLRREGWVIHMKKDRRINNGLGLQLSNKHTKRRVKAKLREDRQMAVGPNDVWGEPCHAIGLSDNGSRYRSHDYYKVTRDHGFQVSMSGKGNCYDCEYGIAA